MQLKVIIEPGGKKGWYTARVPNLPGCISQGKGLKETVENIKEAIDLYLEPIPVRLPKHSHAKIIELAI